MSTQPTPAENARAELRRAQILAAAARCFREHGFHGASVAQICKTAGMSAGHIYHYFENKEAIIAAIVEQDRQRVATMLEDVRGSDDVLEAMIDGVADAVDRHTDPEEAALRLEIAAEAARNPRVAALVREADGRTREDVASTLKCGFCANGLQVDDRTVNAMMEVFSATFEGLMLRVIRNPDLDREAVSEVIRRLMRLNSQPDD